MKRLGGPALLWFLKIILFLLLSWFVIERLFLQANFAVELNFFAQNLRTDRFYFFILALLLMPVNWGLETIKWRVLLKTETTFVNLLKSVVAGITIGFVTPGRTGEFIGRVLYLDEDNKTKVFYLSSIGGFAQTAASLVTGLPFVYAWSNNVYLTETVAGFAAAYMLVYFRFDWLNKLISAIPFLQKYGLTIRSAELPGPASLVLALSISFIRFFSYLLQYVLLLVFFGVGNNYFSLTLHSVIFLLAQTFSPLMPLLDVSYRSGTALYLFNDITSNNLAVLGAVLTVWFINLVVPAIIGYIFILKKKTFTFSHGIFG
jgi:hypothetical protein